MITRLADPAAASSLFNGWNETAIWSCLQGIMGCVLADNPTRPQSSAAVLGDFAFLAGTVNRALVHAVLTHGEPRPLILVPRDVAWSACIEAELKGDATRITRFATCKDPADLDRAHLLDLARAVPRGIELSPIDARLHRACADADWSCDLVSQFPEYEDFQRLALGIVAVEDGVPVAGASTYARYRDGIEIEVDTRPDRRRRGLARACAAALIVAALDQGLYPSWDAHTRASLMLAEQLGYRFDCAYDAYLVSSSRSSYTILEHE